MYWHDGVFRRIDLSYERNGTASAMLEVELYPSEAAASRQRLVITLLEVSQYHAIFDTATLKDNARSGNICCCRSERSARGAVVNLHLLDGFVRVTCQRVRVLSRKA